MDSSCQIYGLVELCETLSEAHHGSNSYNDISSSESSVCHWACKALGPGKGRDIEHVVQFLFGSYDMDEHLHESLARVHRVVLFDMMIRMALKPLP